MLNTIQSTVNQIVHAVIALGFLIVSFFVSLYVQSKQLFAKVLTVFFGLGVAGSASAEVPASVTAAITEAVTDVGIIGAAVMGVLIVIAAFMWMRRVAK